MIDVHRENKSEISGTPTFALSVLTRTASKDGSRLKEYIILWLSAVVSKISAFRVAFFIEWFVLNCIKNEEKYSENCYISFRENSNIF